MRILEKGHLARRTGQPDERCLIISLDPPTDCCGLGPCSCNKKNPQYSPKARVVWQTGDKAGQEATVMAYLLEIVEK
jgi:hypothetical protein